MSAPAPGLATLRERLAASRAGLLEAIARLTEQDFAAEIEAGLSVAGLLAALAAAERAAPADADASADPTADSSVSPDASPDANRSSNRGSVLAPQAIHDLAGARFETLRSLDALEAAPPTAQEAAHATIAAIAAIAAREEASAERIRGKFRADPGA